MNPVLRVRGVAKRFGAVQALAGVDVDFEGGEIHAVLGENGAGKSTLMHVLAGVLRPDAGTILLNGSPVRFASPRAAHRAGIGMVHQHFTLIEALTVTENLALSLTTRSPWRFDAAAVAAQAQAVAERVGFDLGPADTPVFELPVGARQRLEILKALAGADATVANATAANALVASRVLILDEPTAMLTPPEVGQLFTMLRHLRAQGCLVLFITHKLREVKEVADRVTIMRRGRVAGTCATEAITEGEMAERMLGEMVPARRRPPRTAAGAVVLRAARLSARDSRGLPALADASLEVRAAEILGVAGVDGNGQRELFEVLVGLRRPSSGTLSVGGCGVTAWTPAAALAAGIGHIPPDRHHDGLVLGMTVQDNLLLSRVMLARVNWRGILQPRVARSVAAELAQVYAVRCASLDAPARSLSGGNQQRVVVARELAAQPRVLIAANPTRGLDVAAAGAVADALIESAARGCAVVLISTDLDEVLDLSDRVSVLSRGRLSAPLEPPLDPERLGLLMAGAA